jgi:hypothetical protein
MRRSTLLIALALAAAAPAAAQTGNQSDPGIPGVTGSGVAGGTYQSGGFRQLQNAVFRNPNGTVVFASEKVACAVWQQVPETERALREGRAMALMAPGEAGQRAVSADVQPLLADVMSAEHLRDGTPSASSEALVRALQGSSPDGSRHARAARELVRSLEGLFAAVGACPTSQRYIPGETWEKAFRAYQRYIERSPQEFLDTAPPAVIGVASVLYPFVQQALRAAEQ